jgi:hypothetical protein
MDQILLLRDNASLHISLHTRDAIATVEWTILPYPLCSPSLASYDFHLFGQSKDALFADNDSELKHSMQEELQCFSKQCYMTSIQHLTQSWKKCADNEGYFVEK